jgi:G3E family GTPase
LIEQVEFANVIVINKIDLVTSEEIGRLDAILRLLNPTATLIHAKQGEVAPTAILNTGLFNFDQAEGYSRWRQEPRFDPTPETEEYGVGSFLYTANRPFHPQRLLPFLEQDWPGLLRSKGFFWLASRPNEAGYWSQAGALLMIEYAGPWGEGETGSLETGRLETGVADDRDDEVEADLGAPRQELVFIGVELSKAAMIAQLDAALLTDAELAQGPAQWRKYRDQLPAW